MEQQSQLTINVLKNVVEDAPFPIGVYAGPELRILLANRCMRDTWGKGDDILQKSYIEILPELENQQIFDQIQQVLATGIPFNAKNAKVDIVKEGVLETHYFNYSFTPVLDEQGKVFAVMNTGADVTDLNLSRQQTIEAKERLRLAVASADLGTFETNGDLIHGSERFREILGIDQNENSRNVLMGSVHEHDKPARDSAYLRAEKTGQLDYEARVLHPQGTIKWIRVKGSLLPAGVTPVRNVIGVIQDITQQKLFAEKLRKQVKKRTRELRRSNEDLLQFAHVVSHDLKEPVRKIKMFNNLLLDELQPLLAGKSKTYFEKVQNASDRMVTLIDGILNYSAMTGTKSRLEPIDVNLIIADVLNDLELPLLEKAAVVRVGDLPVIEGTQVLIHQLFYNLINNALKFSREDEAPNIAIDCIEKPETYEISVSDNGIGIDQDDLQKIFNAFERLHPKGRYEGTGLGLSLCKKIVERHHGAITATSRPGIGTEFKIILPKGMHQKGLR